MTTFMDTAKAVEPVVRMLENGGCKTTFVRIFTDGSGSIVVSDDDRDRAEGLLKTHGISQRGRQRFGDEGRYHFDIDRDDIKNYVEKPCPHCGKDTLVAS